MTSIKRYCQLPSQQTAIGIDNRDNDKACSDPRCDTRYVRKKNYHTKNTPRAL